ncbi:DUF3891 family protein [Rufibacter glacialis]|uniref:DUF3891 family protein n=1 Tax=Rufibacter glacialis TaxID=1259555 RepID=A0A5M8QE22_9BACT|nr:DUF3891 family protein [Rufibacter glacialis]KAA6433170.1 DUF3891 family protein [Rufibacter glacialis]GGK76781.1 hypothetical protein GCM10011405_25750 [Rufibacter glacialis]
MIVNPHEKGWEIIFQQAHALLAAEIGFVWQPEKRPLYFMQTLAAIAQHDDGQRDLSDGYALTPAGAPANFTQVPFNLEQAQQVMKEASFQGRWRSLLTSMHLSFLYEELRGQKKLWDAFLDEQLSWQKKWRQGLKLTKPQAQYAYDFMQWCDRFSLILCRNELPEMERALEISNGPDQIRYEVTQLKAGPVRVSPWPFQDQEVTLTVEARYLTQLQFKSDQALTQALAQAPIQQKSWLLQP